MSLKTPTGWSQGDARGHRGAPKCDHRGPPGDTQGAPGDTKGAPKGTQKDQTEKTHEFNESGEGTTHDHRSTATI